MGVPLDQLVSQDALEGVRLPTAESMYQSMMRSIGVTDSQEEWFDQVASQQITQEREGSNWFWKTLEVLGRPQAAVSGLLLDLIDGGDFSPLDRITSALQGKEHHRMKEVVDAVAPGQWTRVKLPDFLGGKEIDWAKETIGLAGDIISDPLLALGFFSKLGNSLAFTGERAAKVLNWGRENPAIWESIQKGIKAEQEAIGPISDAAAVVANQRALLREAHTLYKYALEKPEAFARKYGANAASGAAMMEEMAPETGSVLQGLTASERYQAGQQAIVQLRMPWILRKLGLPDKSISLIPKLDEQFGKLLEVGVDRLLNQKFLNTKTGLMARAALKHTFKYGTGNPALDYQAVVIAGKEAADVRRMQPLMKDLADMMAANPTRETWEQVKDYIMRPLEYFGREVRKIPENIRPMVEKFREITAIRAGIHEATPGLKTRLIGGTPEVKPLSRIKAYGEYSRLMEREGIGHYVKPMPQLEEKAFGRALTTAQDLGKNPKYLTWDDFKVAKSEKRAGDKFLKLYNKNLGVLIDEELKRGSVWLSTTIPLRETGYFPRHMTEEAKTLFLSAIENPKIKVAGQPALSVFMKASRGRQMWEMTSTEINRMLIEDPDGLPSEFISEVAKQMRTVLRGKERKTWEKFLGTLDYPHLAFFVEDPLQALSMHVFESIRSVRNQEYLMGAFNLGCRPLAQDALKGELGELVVIPTREGMRTLFGEAWEGKFTDSQLGVYRSILDRKLPAQKGGLGSLWVEVDNTVDLPQAMAANVPRFAIQGDIAEEVQRVLDYSTSGQHFSRFIKAIDETTDFFKAWTLVPFPSYHARNIIGGFWQAFLGDSLEARNYKRAMTWFKKSGMWKEGAPLGKGLLTEPGDLKDVVIKAGTWNGKEITGETLLQYARRFNVLEGSIWKAEFIEHTQGPSKAFRVAMGQQGAVEAIQGVAKQFTQYGKFLQGGFWAGNLGDNLHRMAHFISQLEKGKTPFEAAMSVKKFFFDYHELNSFEKAWLRRIWPFFTWIRKNVPLQLEMLLRQPGKFEQINRLASFIQSDEAQKFDKRLLPRWASEQLGLPVRINRQTGDVEVMLLKSWLPAMDLQVVMQPSPIRGATKQAGELLHPILKGAVEGLSGVSLYTGQKIENFPKEPYPGGFLGIPATRKGVSVAKNIRLLNEINKLTTGQTATGFIPFEQRLVSALGLSPRRAAFDVETLKGGVKYDIASRKGELKKAAARHRKLGKKQLEQFFKSVEGNL